MVQVLQMFAPEEVRHRSWCDTPFHRLSFRMVFEPGTPSLGLSLCPASAGGACEQDWKILKTVQKQQQSWQEQLDEARSTL